MNTESSKISQSNKFILDQKDKSKCSFKGCTKKGCDRDYW